MRTANFTQKVTRKKDSKLDLRIRKDQKSLIAKAAHYEGSDISEFVLKTVLPKAQKVVSKHESISLEKDEWVEFMAILENPPKPNKKLRDAMKRHLASK